MKHFETNEKKAFKAPEFEVSEWIDADGKVTEPIKLSDLKDKFKVVYCFQSWCPGCHNSGFPALQKMTDALKEKDDIVFLAIQTVFEGHYANTYEKMVETQKKYSLKIPFGHDPGDNSTDNRSKILTNYHTGGTPWYIFIDKDDHVVFADFHLNPEKAIEYLKAV
jgi:thiol-disulfide isomerase/thioredoxin